MSRIVSVALLTAAVMLGGTAFASAQTVHRSGSVYHVEACPGPSAPGTARCHAHIVTDSQGNHLVNRFTANRFERNAMANVVPSGYGPTALRLAYNVAVSGSPATIIAIVDAYGYANAAADLAIYRATFGLPALPACPSAGGCFAKYNESGVQGNYPRQNTGWAEETALDLDMASAMCPNCKIILVEANSATYGDLASAVNTAARLGAHVIGNSYGGGESGSQSYGSAYMHPGVAITASSGDNGYGVSFPASSPYVTAVGGTSLYQVSTTARGWTETAWSGAGSGCSSVYGKPTWQTDRLCTMRMVADVSAVADPNTGVAVYGPAGFGSRSAWQVYGGTSVSAQVIGGIYGANGGSVNYGSNPYGNTKWPNTNISWLYDATLGSNGSCGGTYFCNAASGYDGPTGLGTPNGVTGF